MRAFQISAAKLINAVYSRRRRLVERRRGRVFADRYYTEDIGSVRQVRNTLSYVAPRADSRHAASSARTTSGLIERDPPTWGAALP
jgi:hypothetical protein